MWSPSAACVMCVLLGIACDVKPALTRDAQLEEDIQRVMNQIHSLSSRSLTVSSTAGGGYFSALINLVTLFQPLLTDTFLDDLPGDAVCLLSGRQDCGLDAQLTKTLCVELVKPLLSLASALRSQTCPQSNTNGLFGSFLRARDGGLHQALTDILSSVPVSGNLITALRSLVDSAVTYFLEYMATLLQVPIDYVNIALQFGIRTPSLDGRQTCEEGDLAELIMWGLNNNVSWSFSNSIVDILLEMFFAPAQPLCTYPGPECQSPTGVSLGRSASFGAANGTKSSRDVILSCDRRNLSSFNHTLCADVLAASAAASAPVRALCQALSVLSPAQIAQVWSNACYALQALTSPLLAAPAGCAGEDADPPPGAAGSGSGRESREASSLAQLACNYSSWLESDALDPVLVGLCGDNDRERFVARVCDDAAFMRRLLSDQANIWLYAYCANSSADRGHMASEFCVYEQWLGRPTVPVGPPLLEFCMILDGSRLIELACQHTGFFMLLFANPDNIRFMPNCTNVAVLAPLPDTDSFLLDACRYSEWRVTQITADVLFQCVRLDQSGFALEVCSNATFLNGLLQNKANSWLEDHCSSALEARTPEPVHSVSVAAWCDYYTWGVRQVDVSVVAYCWEIDQLAFQKNVCCKAAVYEKLLQNPLNRWLLSVCTGIVETEVLPQVCRYSEWNHPIIVDMTELALCAEIDPLNFTSNVCKNDTVLQNLLTNQDNAWLVQHCANYSKPTVPPDSGSAGGLNGGLTGFKAAEQCQYPSWSVALPDVALMTLCWEQDQTNFVSSVCPNAGLLSVLSQEPSSKWVRQMCTTYTNYTSTAPNNNTTTTTTTAEPSFCLAKNLANHFNWSCSADFNTACQPGASQNVALQMMVRCWADSLKSRAGDLFTQPVAAVLEQAVSTTVVILLALEEAQNKSLHVTENIRIGVLGSVSRYLETEENFDKKRVVLQCFGRVLTSLMQTARDATSEEFFVIKEYFNIPLSSLRSVLSAAHITTIRLILQYYSMNKDTLQLPDQYLSTMVSVLFQNHLVRDGSLFPDLAPLLASASVTDIEALPALQNNINVRETINRNLGHMTMEQREAFGLWYSKAVTSTNITTGDRSFITDTGNLIAYLPFYNFQHLTSAQLLDGLDVLQRNTLTPLKQDFIAQSIISTYRNLTAQDFVRLGNLSCLADPKDLLVYKSTEAFSVIQDIVMNCSRDGLSLPSVLISNMLLNSIELKIPSSVSSDRLAELAELLPMLGVTFLQGLTASQLLAALPALASVSFSPAQASVIIDKISSVTTLSAPGQLQELGTLVVGVRTETLLTLTSDRLLSSLPAMAQHIPGLSPPQANAISTKLWDFPEVVSWLDDVDPLLYCTPLISVLARTRLLINNITATSTKHWNTQQVRMRPSRLAAELLSGEAKAKTSSSAEAIFTEVHDTKPNVVKQSFLSLGTLGQGVSCMILQEHVHADSSPSAVRRILVFLRQQPAPLHTSLKKCVIEVLLKFDFFSQLLKDLGAEIALSLPISTIKKFTIDMMDTLRKTIIQDPRQFLLLPRTKQELLVDKIVQRLGMYTGVFTEQEFRSLGIMASFVVDEVFNQLDRSFFTASLDFLREFCYSSSKMDIVARILQEPATFGPVKNWNQTTLSQVDWFLFFLPTDKLQDISLDLMTVGRIERLFISYRQWEHGGVGSHCLDKNEKNTFFNKQQFVLQFYLGFLKITPQSPTPLVPSCEVLHTTTPAAWPSSSLTSMSSSAFSNCLELMGRDPFLASYQSSQVLRKVKQIYGPVSSLSQSVISQLGGIALELTVDEVSSLRLTERRSIAAMGTVSTWNSKQLAALFTTVLNSTKQSPNQLDSSTLVSMGYIVCGAKSTQMSVFNPVEFSKVVLRLGRLTLSCSEDQLVALVGLLTHSLAFGPISSWGTDVFIEIGVLAAGLPDMAMSALVKEQIEGITPRAISMIPPDKFSVVFSQRQISMFSYEQAAAVTNEQLAALSDVQKTALAMVLTPWEDKPVDFRVGRSLGLVLSHSPVCLTLGLLMLLVTVLRPDPI